MSEATATAPVKKPAPAKPAPKQGFRGQVAKISRIMQDAQKESSQTEAQASRAVAAHKALAQEVSGLLRTLLASGTPEDKQAAEDLKKLQMSVLANLRMLSGVQGAMHSLHNLQKYRLDIE
jgi:cytoplasmic iron level regulating protein YaaA (DUF328/UPF0246 family)